MQKQILSLFWQTSNKNKRLRNASLALPVLAVLTNGIVAPLVLSRFLNLLQKNQVTFDNSIGLIILYAILVILGEIIIWRLALYFIWVMETRGIQLLYNSITSKLLDHSMHFHANRFGGSIVSQASKLIRAYERFWDMIYWSMLPILTMIVGSTVAIILLGYWPYALALFVVSGIFAVVILVSSKFLQPLNTKEAQATTRNTGYFADMVTNVMTIKSFGNRGYEERRFEGSVGSWFEDSRKLLFGVIKATTSYAVMLSILRIMVLVFAVAFAIKGNFPVGIAYLLLAYTLDVTRQLWEFNQVVRDYAKVIGDAHDMTEILNMPSGVVDKSDDKLAVSGGSIQFANVSFTHDAGKGEQVFSDFNLSIADGERIGIVGRSGSGKTTLTRIFLRFSDIQSGAISIDGQDISKVTQQSLHESIAFVPQEPLLFHRSLRENISYGKLDASEAEIVKSSKQAHAWDFISKLPEGLDTIVGERGVKLSGGQRQRIAIARAILKDAPILVLDEATSALDSESEKLIQKSLETLMKGRTSIVIAHRLSTIAKLDRIIVIDQGKIVEDGSHHELLEQNGIYAKLWSHQSGGFIEAD